MPRKHPFPPIEAAVCQRLRAFREHTGLTRVRFAERAGVRTETLSNLEHKLTPLRWSEGSAFCRSHEIDALWLATGEGNPSGPLLDDGWGQKVAPRALFRAAVVTHRAEIDSIRADASRRVGAFVELLLDRAETASEPADKANAKRLLDRTIEALTRIRDAKLQRMQLDEGLRKGNDARVSSSMLQQLLARVSRATMEHGAKKALADALGVQKAQVSQWLTSKRSPNAEDTLRLLEWVTTAEAKQKKEPSGGDTPKGRVTRKSKNTTNEKAKSDRRKR